MKIVYIAGPYGDADGYLQIDRNIAAAREAAATLSADGIGYICPHLNSAHFEAVVPEVPVSFWYELDEELLKRADGVLVVGGWNESKGTKREIDLAKALGYPVFYHNRGEYLACLKWARS